MTCLECGNKIGAFRRRFTTTEYCSEACQQKARAKQQASSLALLLSNKQRHKAEAQAEVKVEAPPARPAAVQEPSPTPAPAPFSVPLPRAQASPEPPILHGDPAPVETGTHWRDVELPASSPRLVPGGSVAVMAPLQRTTGVPRPEMSVLEAAFPAVTIRSVSHNLRPLWVDYTPEPGPQPAIAECIRQSMPISRTWAGALALSTSEFSGSIFLPEDRLVPSGAAFGGPAARQAAPQPQVQKSAPGGYPQAPDQHPLLPAFSPEVNGASLPPGLSRASAKSAGVLPLACPPAHSIRTPEMEGPQLWVRIDRHSAARDARSPRPAGWAQITSKLAAAALSRQTSSSPAPWRQEIGLSPATQLRVVPPRWQIDVPIPDPEVTSFLKTAPEVEAALEVPSPAPRWWMRLPNLRSWPVRLVCILLLSLVAAGVIARLSSHQASNQAGASTGWLEPINNAIRQRAAVDMEDDFRAGLNHWNGAPDWAQSWSYDSTGVLHPGKLALYQESEGLSDYRLEFRGIIEKNSLGWAYRASDVRNYYAAKLELTHRGAIAALKLERFAVIDGHEDKHVDLPLPVIVGNITTFRVSTNVEGSRFTTYIDGKVVDTWSDTRLTRGGVGFFADPGTGAGIEWLHVTQRDDLLGHWCAQLSRLFADKKPGEVRH